MALDRITDLADGTAAVGTELIEVSQLSTTVDITAITISALASDNSYNDSGNGFVAAGFAVNDRVNVTGFTGNVANNIVVGTITALTTGKMTIGGTDGDVIVDDAAGESVTIAKWTSRRMTSQELADLAGSGLPVGGADGDVLTKQSATDFDAGWEAPTGGGGGSPVPALSARSVRTGGGTSGAAGWTNVPMTSIVEDDQGWYDGTYGGFKPPAGKYLVIVNIGLGGAGIQTAGYAINGAGFYQTGHNNGNNFDEGGSAVVEVDGTETISACGYFTANVGFNNADCRLQVVEIASASVYYGSVIKKTSLRKSGSQSIPNNAYTAVTWDVEQVDETDSHSGSGSTILIPVGAKRFRASGTTAWAGNNVGARSTVIAKGASFPADIVTFGLLNDSNSWEAADTIDTGWVDVDGTTYVAGTTTLAMYVQQDSGGALNLNGGWGPCNFTIEFDFGLASQTIEGTAFPTTPSDGDRFYRTDRKIEYYWDATVGEWLSTHLYLHAIASQDSGTINPVTANSDGLRSANPGKLLGCEIFIEQFTFQCFNTAGSTGSNYLTARLYYNTPTTTPNLGAGLSGAGDATATWTSHAEAINTVVPATANMISVNLTEAGSANCYLGCACSYRLVG